MWQALEYYNKNIFNSLPQAQQNTKAKIGRLTCHLPPCHLATLPPDDCHA